MLVRLRVRVLAVAGRDLEQRAEELLQGVGLRGAVGLLARLGIDDLRVGGLDLDTDAAKRVTLGFAQLLDLRLGLLDARGVIAVTERQNYISRVRELAKACGAAFLNTRDGGAA